MKRTTLLFSLVLIFSLILNVGLMGVLVVKTLEGCAETEGGELGTLTQDIKVGVFESKKALFALPKGLVVRDTAASGMDWFEPHRFKIVVTSENERLVDYSKTVDERSEYYSALTEIK